METLTSGTFAGFVEDNPLAIVAFVRPDAPAVIPFLPVLAALARMRGDVAVGVVDVGREPALAHDFRVEHVPTLAVLRARHLVYLEPGAVSLESLQAIIDAARMLKLRGTGATSP